MIDQYVAEILGQLANKDEIQSSEISEDSAAIFPAIQRLKGRDMIDFRSIENLDYTLTKFGIEIISKGSPEFNLTKRLTSEGVHIQELKEFSHAFIFALKNNWVKQENGKIFLINRPESDKTRCMLKNLCRDSRNKKITAKNIKDSDGCEVPNVQNAKIFNQKNKLSEKDHSLIHSTSDSLKNMKITDTTAKIHSDESKPLNLANVTEDDIKMLKKRKLIEIKKIKTYIITKGPKYSRFLRDLATDLTADMVSNKTFSEYEFKDYNYDTLGFLPEKGNLHPITKMRDQMARVFMDMGFCEMHTDKWVESSFWNFDALFQPQNHPSRDSQDTFFIENTLPIDAHPNYIERVKNIHENGGYDSKGYQNTWEQSEASKLVLRTHTTSVSARYLYSIAQRILKHKSASSPTQLSLLDNNSCFEDAKTCKNIQESQNNNVSDLSRETIQKSEDSLDDDTVFVNSTEKLDSDAVSDSIFPDEICSSTKNLYKQLVQLNSKKLESVPSILPFLNLQEPKWLNEAFSARIPQYQTMTNVDKDIKDTVPISDFNFKINGCTNLQDAYKFYSIDKVFRNETADATHLAEFHQIEGVIVGKNLSIGQLMGVLSQFYERLGLKKLKFKPAYNPYTEPSMEIFGYHDGLKKWIEIGNSGIFRPEMLLPMGFDESYVVFGWGLSLERPTMIKYGINNIRDLVGHRVCLDFIRKSEICML